MRFLVDVCVGSSIVNWLREKGYDVAFVRDQDAKMPDESILQWGFSEKRILITLDKDFGYLSVYKSLPHHGVIKLPNVPAEKRQVFVQEILLRHSDELDAGAIVTVRGSRIRIRRKKI